LKLARRILAKPSRATSAEGLRAACLVIDAWQARHWGRERPPGPGFPSELRPYRESRLER
jgi:hypothetical protein